MRPKLGIIFSGQYGETKASTESYIKLSPRKGLLPASIGIFATFIC